MTSLIISYFSLFLPLESLDSVAYERPTQKRAELFGCLQPGSLSGAAGRKNHRHREVHAALCRLAFALPGLAGWENPWMSGPVRLTGISLHVGVVNLHQFVGGGHDRSFPNLSIYKFVGGVETRRQRGWRFGKQRRQVPTGKWRTSGECFQNKSAPTVGRFSPKCTK